MFANGTWKIQSHQVLNSSAKTPAAAPFCFVLARVGDYLRCLRTGAPAATPFMPGCGGGRPRYARGGG